MRVHVCVIHMYARKCVHRHSLRASRKVFHFIRAVSLEIASDGTVRGDGPSAARYVSFFQDTFPLTPSRTYTQSRRMIIKKIEGEASLLIRPANCGTSPSNPSAILDPIIFEEKHSLFLSPSFCPISESRLPVPFPATRYHYFCPLNGTWTYVSLYIWMADERGSPKVPTRRKSEILSLQ